MTRISLAALLLISCGAGPAPQRQPVSSASTMNQRSEILYPGVVIDPAARVAFANSVSGGLAAIDLSSGQIRWEADCECTPLLVGDGLVAASVGVKNHPNRFQIVWLDAATGAIARTSNDIALPDWVSVIPARGREFQISARRSDSALFADWRARAFYAGGARPTQEVLDRERKEASGSVRVDPVSGAVELRGLDAGKATSELPAPLQDLDSVQYRIVDRWETRPLALGNRVVSLELAHAEAGQELVLNTWSAADGRRLSRQKLASGHNLGAMVSPDLRHLFVNDTGPESEGVWRVFSLENGRQLANFKNDFRVLAASATSSNIIVLSDAMEPPTQRVLQAFDPDSGQKAWSVAVAGPVRFSPPR